MYLDCPQCGTSNPETETEELVFSCDVCRLVYDMIVCESCDQMVGTYFGDEDECPACSGPLIIQEPETE